MYYTGGWINAVCADSVPRCRPVTTWVDQRGLYCLAPRYRTLTTERISFGCVLMTAVTPTVGPAHALPCSGHDHTMTARVGWAHNSQHCWLTSEQHHGTSRTRLSFPLGVDQPNDDMWTAQICFVVVLLRHAGLICPLSSHDFCAAVGQDMLGKVAWQDLAPILPSPPNPSSPLPSLRHRSPMAWHFRHISVSCGPRGFST